MRASGEVKGESWLVGAKVVYMEDEIFGKVFFTAPDCPADAGVDETVLVAANVDAPHERKAEVPLQLWVYERRDETAARRVHMDGCVPAAPPREFTFLVSN